MKYITCAILFICFFNCGTAQIKKDSVPTVSQIEKHTSKFFKKTLTNEYLNKNAAKIKPYMYSQVIVFSPYLLANQKHN